MTERNFVIRCKVDDSLHWSNTKGWVEEDLDFFTETDMQTLFLPLDGYWMRYSCETKAVKLLQNALRALNEKTNFSFCMEDGSRNTSYSLCYEIRQFLQQEQKRNA